MVNLKTVQADFIRRHESYLEYHPLEVFASIHQE